MKDNLLRRLVDWYFSGFWSTDPKSTPDVRGEMSNGNVYPRRDSALGSWLTETVAYHH